MEKWEMNENKIKTMLNVEILNRRRGIKQHKNEKLQRYV